ncbi:adenylyltransferase/cytidyltransferase family protein [Desulfovibrio sp. OttesenSCG-928-C06]|nr:adenylyltransferase/cytidyltransferase family protein [Desulfovibrio sp. OttesenSCG-928-C06]
MGMVAVRGDGLFFSRGQCTHQDGVFAINSHEELLTVLKGKKLWIVGQSFFIRKSLVHLFQLLASMQVEVIDEHIALNEPVELKNFLAKLSLNAKENVLFLADENYMAAYNLISGLHNSELKVLTPTGLLMPSVRGGKYASERVTLDFDDLKSILIGRSICIYADNHELLASYMRKLEYLSDLISVSCIASEEPIIIDLNEKNIKSCSIHDIRKSKYDIAIILASNYKMFCKACENINNNTLTYALIPMHISDKLSGVWMYEKKVGEFLFYAGGFGKQKTQISENTSPPIAMKSKYFYSIQQNTICSQSAWQFEQHQNSLWIFGRSHAAGIAISLQRAMEKQERSGECCYDIRGFGIGGGSTSNAYLQLIAQDLRPNDIVVYYEDATCLQNNDVEYIRGMKFHCERQGARFVVVWHPHYLSLRNLTGNEKLLLAAHSAMKGTLIEHGEQKKHIQLSNILSSYGILSLDTHCIFDSAQGRSSFKVGEACDNAGHLHGPANATIASFICEFILKTTPEYEDESVYADAISAQLPRVAHFSQNSSSIMEWLAKTPRFEKNKDEIIGAIVMNCNPFTLGHQYIIREAMRKVERLYIFVVEEDRSFFSFEERYAMVCEGVKEFGDRVSVVPSGQFIISSSTFPDYFSKETITYKPDTSTDILIFASTIAPALGIKVRLFGDEPFCAVTSAYHEQLEDLLPKGGILPIRIPRLEQGGVAISASAVRNILMTKKLSQLAKLVPASSMPYLIGKIMPSESGCDVELDKSA